MKRITNNQSLSQSQQQKQATDVQDEEIRMIINLPYFKGTSEKLRHILKSHKIRFIFYTESALRKILCKPKNRVAAEDKDSTLYQNDWNLSK